MLFLLIFPILVAGFIACHIHPVHSYKLHRYEGQYLYLKSAELGLKCFALALLLAILGHYWIPNALYLGWGSIRLDLSAVLKDSVQDMLGISDKAEVGKTAWFVLFSALTFMSSLLIKAWGHLSLFRRFGAWRARIFVIAELLADSPLDNLLFRLSLEKGKQIMLTMADRKVYVGKVVSLGEPSETSGMDQDIAIVPLMSGYRDKDTLKLKFTTYYDEVDADISLSLRQDSILSATEFNFAAYQQWNAGAQLLAE